VLVLDLFYLDYESRGVVYFGVFRATVSMIVIPREVPNLQFALVETVKAYETPIE
jgi:hypothetical protein